MLALTEPASYNSANDPVNAFFTLCPLGLNFSTLPLQKAIEEMYPTLQCALFSSNSVYYLDTTGNLGSDNFNWSLQQIQSPPYNLSSTLQGYTGLTIFNVNNTDVCPSNNTEIVNWALMPMSDNLVFNSTFFTPPVVGLQFDGETSNFLVRGYVEAIPMEKESAKETFLIFVGEYVISFQGVIDRYHSDVVRDDTEVPMWLRTVGYQNDSANVGYRCV